MAKTIKNVFDNIKLVLNKERRGFVTDAEISTAVEFGCRETFKNLVNEFRQTGVVSAGLSPFITSDTTAFASGIKGKPNGFIDIVSLETATGQATIVRNDQQWVDLKNSEISGVDTDEPIVRVSTATIGIFPATITSGTTMYYVKAPDAGGLVSWFVYASTASADGKGFDYVDGSTTDLSFSTVSINEIIYHSLLFLGVSKQSPMLLQFATK